MRLIERLRCQTAISDDARGLLLDTAKYFLPVRLGRILKAALQMTPALAAAADPPPDPRQLAVQEWTRFCANMVAWRDRVAEEDPETYVSLADVAVVVAAMDAIATHLLCPDPSMITVEMLKHEADPHLYVVKEMREWALACVRPLYSALSSSNKAYRLD